MYYLSTCVSTDGLLRVARELDLFLLQVLAWVVVGPSVVRGRSMQYPLTQQHRGQNALGIVDNI